ncbi:MAG: hypothetical protein JWN13_6105 [Betaproteobacteria bacterium]|jgi:hypothetical protein|nr:hypothetical protein [Betaproteobacteria bacterium]
MLVYRKLAAPRMEITAVSPMPQNASKGSPAQHVGTRDRSGTNLATQPNAQFFAAS